MDECTYTPLFSPGNDQTQYRKLDGDFVDIVRFNNQDILTIAPEALRVLAREAFRDVSFLLRKSHLDQLASIITSPEASGNDRYVASTLLENAVEAANEVLPSCQDTGTAIVFGQKGQQIWTGDDDKKFLSHGIYDAYTNENLRYSQMAPLSMFEEVNTGCNLPAQIDIYATQGDEYRFLFIAKGGGSANKTFLYQETKSLLNEDRFLKFWQEKIPTLGTTACPPYHIAIVIGGTSAEMNLKTAKLASAKELDGLPTAGGKGGHAFRDLEWEQRLLQVARQSNIGAQFGGYFLAHDVRVIRLPRHAASNPVSIAVSCSADRNIKAKITRDGLFLERLERDLSRFQTLLRAPDQMPVQIDLNQPMPEILAALSNYPVGTLLHLNGSMIVARDIAHARIAEMIAAGSPMPEYMKKHPVYYAGPAKTPPGMASGSFGPTTAGRMDLYVDQFQSLDGSLIMIAKGNRSQAVTDACRRHGGFYLGSIGGPAAILAKNCIKKVETVDFADLGMEAIRKIEVENFPAFIICDDKGHDLFKQFGYYR